jgi:PadR family transcriptional regulator, regulatory protein PadR
MISNTDSTLTIRLNTYIPVKAHKKNEARNLAGVFEHRLRVGQGSLYPALAGMQRLDQGAIGASENNRKARFYSLTTAGRKHLATELENWERLSGAVNPILAEI